MNRVNCKCLQYSRWERINAVYVNLSNWLGKYGVARAKVPSSPWHLLTTLSIWVWKVRCWSRVTPSSLTVVCGLIEQLSSIRWKNWKSSGILLPTALNVMSWVLAGLIVSPCDWQNSLVALKLAVSIEVTTGLVHGWGCNPHRSTTFAKPEITSFMTSYFGFKMEIAKMARENFSNGAFYNITKNQDNPIKTVGRDSFFEPQNP